MAGIGNGSRYLTSLLNMSGAMAGVDDVESDSVFPAVALILLGRFFPGFCT